jgi:hypothetical protein
MLGMSGAVYPLLICCHGILVVVEDRVEFCFVFYAGRLIYTYIYVLTGNKNIINYIKAQRLAWFGHILCMPDNSMVKKVYEWSPALTRSLGRPKNRWENDVKSDITRMKINWKDCIRNRIKWKKLVEKAKTSLKL